MLSPRGVASRACPRHSASINPALAPCCVHKKYAPAAGDVFPLERDIVYRADLLLMVARATDRGHRRDSGGSELPPVMASEPRPFSEGENLPLELRLLVAEDNPVNQHVLRKQLKLLGISADFANDGSEAFEFLERRDYPLLLTDLHMPGMDGYELAETIRAAEGGGRRMPILALKANALKSDLRRCVYAGMDEYLVKPVELAALKTLLQRWLPNPTSTRGDAQQVPLPSASSSYASVPCADLSAVSALFGREPEGIRFVLDAFLDGAAETVAEFAPGRATRSAVILQDAAHRQKSSAQLIGARRLATICEDIEHESVEIEGRRLRCLLAEFDAELDAVLLCLDAMP